MSHVVAAGGSATPTCIARLLRPRVRVVLVLAGLLGALPQPLVAAERVPPSPFYGGVHHVLIALEPWIDKTVQEIVPQDRVLARAGEIARANVDPAIPVETVTAPLAYVLTRDETFTAFVKLTALPPPPHFARDLAAVVSIYTALYRTSGGPLPTYSSQPQSILVNRDGSNLWPELDRILSEQLYSLKGVY